MIEDLLPACRWKIAGDFKIVKALFYHEMIEKANPKMSLRLHKDLNFGTLTCLSKSDLIATFDRSIVFKAGKPYRKIIPKWPFLFWAIDFEYRPV